MPESPTPDPAARLAELRRQREAVARHLEWLDRELAAAAGAATPPVSRPGATPSAPFPAQPAAPPAAASAAVASSSPSGPGAAGRPLSRPPFSPDAILSQESGGLTMRDKLGCIAIVAIVAFFILSIFWVLPYFLHDQPAENEGGETVAPAPAPPVPPAAPGP